MIMDIGNVKNVEWRLRFMRKINKNTLKLLKVLFVSFAEIGIIVGTILSFYMYFNAELLVDKMHYGFAFVVCVIFLTHDYKNG